MVMSRRSVWLIVFGLLAMQAALALAEEATRIAPGDMFAEMALGSAEAAMHNRAESLAAWQSAPAAAEKMEPDAQPSWVPDIERQIAANQGGAGR